MSNPVGSAILSLALEAVCAISPVVNLTLGENEAANAVLGGL